MTEIKVYNKKTISNLCHCSIKTLNAEIQIMLQSPDIAHEFGYYSRKRFTRKQLNIMRENIPILDVLPENL